MAVAGPPRASHSSSILAEPVVTGSRTRSFGGCLTCRSRHSKCDEKRPVCTTCRRAGLHCEGYEAKLCWIFSNRVGGITKHAEEEGASSGCRRLLFTEDERAAMSRQLARSLGALSLDRALLQVDSKSSEVKGEPISLGPFHIFQAREPEPVEEVEPVKPSSSSLSPPPGWTFDDFLPELETLACDWSSPVDLLLTASELMQEAPSHHLYDVLQIPETTLVDQISPVGQQLILSPAPLSIPLTVGSPDDWSNRVPSDAFFLIEHYRTKVITQMAPVKVTRKSPWQILHLPSALNTLAEMTMWQTTNHARSALFYSLLAISSFHLVKWNPEDEFDAARWRAAGEKYKDQATKHLQKSLRQEMAGPTKAKYKEMLMAILNMITICVYSGEHNNIRFYLLDAERLIRTRGLAKTQFSRKARLLHHLYGFVRIITESTFVLHGRCFSSPAPALLYTSPHISGLIDHAFRMRSSQSTANLYISEEKDHDVAMKDIHLEDLRRNDTTLFPEVYGLPEVFFGLVSETTRIANEIEHLQISPESAFCTIDGLAERAKTLEEVICSWNPGEGDEAPNYLITAMHAALIIFFYRRVRNINPTVLQSHVETTIRSLLALEKADSDRYNMFGGATNVWPGFIAACEALDPALQESAMSWLCDAGTKYGQRHFDLAADVVRDVWRGREEKKSLNWTWVDVMRERDVCFIFS